MSYLQIDYHEVAFADVDGLNERYRSARRRVWRKPVAESVAIAEPVVAADRLPKVRTVRISCAPTSRPTPARTRLSTVIEIQWTVAREFGVTRNDVISHRRDAQSATARQVGMWLCRNLLPLSLPQIGRAFGGKDHTTILHGLRKIDRLREECGVFRDRLETMRLGLEASANSPQPAVTCEGEKS